jgi:hypothetical protein
MRNHQPASDGGLCRRGLNPCACLVFSGINLEPWRLRFYLLFGDEHVLSAPRSGAGGGGAGGERPRPCTHKKLGKHIIKGQPGLLGVCGGVRK